MRILRGDLVPAGRAGGLADGVDDRAGGQQAGNGAETDRPLDADPGDQAQREEGSEDRAQVAHNPLELVRPPVRLGRDDVRQQGVAGGYLKSAWGPGGGTENHLPLRGGARGCRAHYRGRRVPADSDLPPSRRVVCEDAATEPGRPHLRVGNTLDRPQRSGGSAERGGQRGGQQRGRDLVADVGEEAGRADALTPRVSHLPWSWCRQAVAASVMSGSLTGGRGRSQLTIPPAPQAGVCDLSEAADLADHRKSQLFEHIHRVPVRASPRTKSANSPTVVTSTSAGVRWPTFAASSCRHWLSLPRISGSVRHSSYVLAPTAARTTVLRRRVV